MNSIYYVYKLIDSRDNLPFYVGKGKHNRMLEHEKLVKKNRLPNNNQLLFNKIRDIHTNGAFIIYNKIYENLTDSVALNKERETIRQYGRINCNSGILCNLTSGGAGMGGFKHSTESNEANSIRKQLWFSNPEHRKQTADSTRIGMYTSGHIDKISKTITLKNPEGKLVTMKNISKFCRDNNLTNANVYKLLNGEMHQHKGWTLPNTVIIPKVVIDFKGNVYTFNSISKFCVEHELCDVSMSCLLLGKILSHKNFIKYTELNGKSPQEYIREIKKLRRLNSKKV